MKNRLKSTKNNNGITFFEVLVSIFVVLILLFNIAPNYLEDITLNWQLENQANLIAQNLRIIRNSAFNGQTYSLLFDIGQNAYYVLSDDGKTSSKYVLPNNITLKKAYCGTSNRCSFSVHGVPKEGGGKVSLIAKKINKEIDIVIGTATGRIWINKNVN
ncbi:pilus assembly FimT family protein [Thermodesulfobium sp.]